MVSRANWMGRTGFIRQAFDSAMKNTRTPAEDPGRVARTTRGGVTGGKPMPAGPAGEATRRRRGGIADTVSQAVTRGVEQQNARRDQNLADRSGVTGVLGRAITRGVQQRAGQQDVMAQKRRPTMQTPPRQGIPRKSTPLRDFAQEEPNMGGTRTQNPVSEATRNLARRSRSGRILR